MTRPGEQKSAEARSCVVLPPEAFAAILCPEILSDLDQTTFLRVADGSPPAMLAPLPVAAVHPAVVRLQTYTAVECLEVLSKQGSQRLIACSGTLEGDMLLQAAATLGLKRVFLPLSVEDLLVPPSLCDEVWVDHAWAQGVLTDAGYTQVKVRASHPPTCMPTRAPLQLTSPTGPNVTIPPLPPDQVDLLLGVKLLAGILWAVPDSDATWALHPRTNARLIRNLLRAAHLGERVRLMPCGGWEDLNRILAASDVLLLPMQRPLRLGWARFAAQIRPKQTVIAGATEQLCDEQSLKADALVLGDDETDCAIIAMVREALKQRAAAPAAA